jgi:hypothetical protein
MLSLQAQASSCEHTEHACISTDTISVVLVTVVDISVVMHSALQVREQELRASVYSMLLVLLPHTRLSHCFKRSNSIKFILYIAAMLSTTTSPLQLVHMPTQLHRSRPLHVHKYCC